MHTSQLVAGVDEAGRGPLAGPVIAAAVILDPRVPIPGLADSKQLSPKKRLTLYKRIQKYSLAWGLGRCEETEIDELNIHCASLLAMERAVAALHIPPTHILVDGKHKPNFTQSCEAIVHGDALIPQISAASILAKVARDREMIALSKIYPDYGFAQHKGYGTAVHLRALQQYGATALHRKSYAPVQLVLVNQLIDKAVD